MFDADFREGLRNGLPIALSAAPFGALFGAVAVDNGLSVVEATIMSGTVYAGASQLVGIELFGQKVAPWLIVLSVFAVNFRHILYSAAIAKMIAHWSFAQKTAGFFLLVDPQFAEAVRRYENGQTLGFSWYVGFATPVYVFWLAMTIIGASLGNLIGDPKAIGLDVLLPIYFMGMVLSFRTRANFYPVMLASAVGATAAYHFVGSPWHVSLGALVGILVAVLYPPSPDTSGANEGENR
ncbi:AzlC family ABC transporter permease [Rhizobium sp. RM]|uniref:AzlC family ABC transporter permease n=1 Tax=Rhizobium sp. RM TaxID=2748079 RepID=UPI00110D858B|nr:AzlC family ABC transporter permease [Rhizobium sp. RM]NWJ26645.1 AzlC family ABC transporter permease [Rhizobium sp. RM]TMV22530.1 AzlC family ABC transporter permease [Rhizobium sp. Td3]